VKYFWNLNVYKVILNQSAQTLLCPVTYTLGGTQAGIRWY